MRKQELVEVIDQLFKELNKVDTEMYRKYSEHFYAENFNHWSSVTYDAMRNTLFKLITGDPRDFDKFYDDFDSPGVRHGKPVAWIDGQGFIPDRISDAIAHQEMQTPEKINLINSLYRKCIKLEQAHE